MENGALDIHDAAAWDDSALVAAYDAAIEKYEESHGGGSSARTTAASRKHAPRAAPPNLSPCVIVRHNPIFSFFLEYTFLFFFFSNSHDE